MIVSQPPRQEFFAKNVGIVIHDGQDMGGALQFVRCAQLGPSS